MSGIANGPFGLEHPLVTTRDLVKLGEQYEALGFNPTPITWHPWGTHNRLVMMEGNFIELIGIGDPAKIASDPEGGAKFGRHLARFLDEREGVSLLALHSSDIETDVAAVAGRGLFPDARIAFRRDVTLPDGREGQAEVSLATFIDPRGASVSHFLCQQHRPEMIFDPQWRIHRNGARRIAWCAYVARNPAALQERFAGLFGTPSANRGPGGFQVATPGGHIFVFSAAEAASLLGLEDRWLGELQHDGQIAAIGIEVCELAKAKPFVLACGGSLAAGVLQVPPHIGGHVALQLFEKERDPLSALVPDV